MIPPIFCAGFSSIFQKTSPISCGILVRNCDRVEMCALTAKGKTKVGRWWRIAVAVGMLGMVRVWSLKHGWDKDAAVVLLREWCDRLCLWVDPVYVAIHTLSIALCLPSPVIFEVTASLLFGFFPAFLFILSAKVLVASLSFWIARSVFKTWSSAVKWAHRSRYFHLLSRGFEQDGWRFVLLARLSPLPSYSINHALAATDKVGFLLDFLLPTVIGCVPTILKNTSLGALAASALALASASHNSSVWSCLFLLVGFFSSVIVSRKVKKYSIRVSVAETFPCNDNPFDSALCDEDEKYAEQIQLQDAFMSFCEICMDTKRIDEMFTNDKSCTHAFCTDCISSYISSKLQENIATIKCPDPKCRGILDPLFCRTIIPDEVFGRWETALCENLFLGLEKVYCPFRDCSAMMVVEEGDEVSVTSSECPNCRRLFCAQCRVAWHAGMECEEFQGLNEDEREREDLLLMELAKGKRWMRCPRCKFYVEKINGCPHISCRCGYQFCYRCGSDWNHHSICRPQ